jgi:hypothetical protein
VWQGRRVCSRYHQGIDGGIDGEWSDKSGIIVYHWNDQGSSRPNSGRDNWKKRWSCCQEREEQAPRAGVGGTSPMTMDTCSSRQ